MRTTLTGISLCLATVSLVACGKTEPEVIAGTNPPIDAAVCAGDETCESDMRDLSYKLEESDDANGDGVIDQDELNAARKRIDDEEAAAASSSAAAASSQAKAEEEAARSSEAEAQAEAERAEAEKKEAERKAAAEREQAAQQKKQQQQQEAPQQPQPEPEPEPEPEPRPSPAPDSGPPPLEWATLGPYESIEACEDTRSRWPVQSDPCFNGPNGKAFFRGMRQAPVPQ